MGDAGRLVALLPRCTSSRQRGTINDVPVPSPVTMNQATQVLLVVAGGRRCALPLGHIVETMRPLPIEAILDPPPGVAGVSVIRGRPLPVVDLGALLASDDGRPAVAASRFVTLRVGERQVALAVDAVIGVRELENTALHELPPLLQSARSTNIRSLSALDLELFAILDTGRLVT